MDEKNKERFKLISQRIKELRHNAGYSSHETFAQDNSLDRKGYWRIESGQYNFTFKSLFRILDIHGISIDEFFEGIEKNKPNQKTKS